MSNIAQAVCVCVASEKPVLALIPLNCKSLFAAALQREALRRSRRGVLTAGTSHRYNGPESRSKVHAVHAVHDAW